ncbi:MAG TPA: 16S rRNA (cytosine(1402)-N(4))-methyltransferase RsmH [Acidimicrobiales bacterium]|nr:16S rRNA (cytosine(1402)-N(4))-methyltransferase RsmH [Acidimicrobiales bacterium]
MTEAPAPEPTAGADFAHRPVMVDEIVALFADAPGGVVVDATVGGGGHARALLVDRDDRAIVGLDRDPVAIAATAAALADFGDRVTLRRARFDQIAEVLASLGLDAVAGVLFDLGVSSPQLDRPERGFSYRAEAPLDMRMDPDQDRSAADVVNTYAEADLAAVLARYGDERFARRIARAIVAARPVTTTTQLAELVRDAIPAPARRRGGHPAKRSFQAIRIEVNDELAVLPVALDRAVALLAPRGRCAVLSYHSGEDRIVKQRFLEAESGGCECPQGLPCVCGATPTVRLLRRGGWTPSPAEVAANPRAESARLRAVEKLAVAS